ncbi:MAG: succinylglutamate desuccinylase/aspartoacylase family protein [Gammaproteobacteria bacterium]|nr:succinylglutamate desuccinylase/aspartoacylase family protein [Gammaproteobacteria bacterium]
MRPISRINTDIDFELNGKQVSCLAVPNSTNESAYGTVTIPITAINNGQGPTLLLTGGVHGDEHEGPVALMKLARALEPEEINGRVIIIPCLNLPAVLAAARCSPIDGLNLNRIFPGERDGTITMTIAHYVAEVLAPMTDIQMDLHSGGKTLQYIPCAMMNEYEDKDLDSKCFAAIKAFGAPITLRDKILDSTGLLTGVFEEKGVVAMGAELGGAGMVSKDAVSIAEHGVMNILKHFNIIEGDIVTPDAQGRSPTKIARIQDTQCYVMSPDDGLYEPFVELGDRIEVGQPIGQVHYPQHVNKEPWTNIAPRSGFLLCKRPPGSVQRGDNVAIIAQHIEG